LREEEHEDIEHEEGAVQGCLIDHAQTAMQELVDVHQRNLRQHNDNDISTAYNTLNTDQKRVVDTVVEQIGHADKPIRLFVSGQGGTGKSLVIDVLNKLVSKEYGRTSTLPVVVAALTGLASKNIKGITIHRVLNLPVEHGKPANYNALNAEQLATLCATLRGLKLLVIDEISMVSSLTLLYIHMRLTKVMSNNDLFGGIKCRFIRRSITAASSKGKPTIHSSNVS